MTNILYSFQPKAANSIIRAGGIGAGRKFPPQNFELGAKTSELKNWGDRELKNWGDGEMGR